MFTRKQEESAIKNHLDRIYKIVNDHFKYDLKKHTYIAGGSIASIILGDSPRNYDFFFKSDHALATFKAVIRVTEPSFKETDNAFSFDFYDHVNYRSISCQFIKLSTLAPEKTILTFDFFHTMNFYNDDNLTITHLNTIYNKELIYNLYTLNPNGAPVRYRKFIKRGYKPAANCAENIILTLSLNKPLIAMYGDQC